MAADTNVFYSTDEFTITEFDLKMYLRNGPPPEAGSEFGTRERVLQALSDLYAAHILAADADAADKEFLSAAEQIWIAEHEVRIEKIRKYLAWRVGQQLEQTDWEAEAKELYLAKPSQYVVPESVTLRTLLIRTLDRSVDEAKALASSLVADEMTMESFANLVIEHSEDEVGRESGGLMVDVQRGQTVKPFEDAAFAMRSPGEIVGPIVSQYGAHMIQLETYTPPRQLTFEEARPTIIANLKKNRPIEYRSTLQNEARERKGPGFVEHTEALDTLMLRTSNGALGPR